MEQISCQLFFLLHTSFASFFTVAIVILVEQSRNCLLLMQRGRRRRRRNGMRSVPTGSNTGFNTTVCATATFAVGSMPLPPTNTTTRTSACCPWKRTCLIFDHSSRLFLTPYPGSPRLSSFWVPHSVFWIVSVLCCAVLSCVVNKESREEVCQCRHDYEDWNSERMLCFCVSFNICPVNIIKSCFGLHWQKFYPCNLVGRKR